MHRLLAPLVIVLLAAACAPSKGLVPVSGDDDDLILMAGEWKGDYEAPEVGRTGTIEFKLAVGRRTARATVLMHEPGSAEPRVLAVKHIEIDGNVIRGVLEPYVLSECGCEAKTVFEGHANGNRIAGSFTSELQMPSGPVEQRGYWTATRVN